jgi:hypothetical protein
MVKFGLSDFPWPSDYPWLPILGEFGNTIRTGFQQLYYYYEEFMEKLKLGTVVSNFDDLVSKLLHRFDALPVHRLCYYQSYYPLTEAMKNLRQSMDADPSAGTKVDSFGMTPFHILALAQTPNLSLF